MRRRAGFRFGLQGQNYEKIFKESGTSFKGSAFFTADVPGVYYWRNHTVVGRQFIHQFWDEKNDDRSAYGVPVE